MKKEAFLKGTVHVIRLLLGLCFVFSGFVKAVDPLGTTYKITEYLEAFGMPYLIDLSFLGSVLLSASEFFLGMGLLLGVWKKSISLLTLIYLLFYTPLTLYIWIQNPVTDCGCFGDALKLSNAATFFKNLALLSMALLVFIRHESFVTFFGHRTGRWSMLWCMAFPILLSAYSSMHLPLIDFLPYRTGNHLPALMVPSESAVRDSFELVFLYEKDGETREFSLEEAPVNDTSWTFVDRMDKQVVVGELPPVHDFVIEHPLQGDITDEVLSDTSYTFLLVSNKLEKTNTVNLTLIRNAFDYAKKHGYAFYGLTNSTPEAIEDWLYEADADIEFCTMDNKTLQTMMRSNPGLMLLKNGTVMQKWGYRDIPDFSTLHARLNLSDWGARRDQHPWKTTGKLLLLLLLPILFFYLLHRGTVADFSKKLHPNKKQKTKKETNINS